MCVNAFGNVAPWQKKWINMFQNKANSQTFWQDSDSHQSFRCGILWEKNVWPVLNIICTSNMVASRTAFNVHPHVHLFHVPADWDAIKTQLVLPPGEFYMRVGVCVSSPWWTLVPLTPQRPQKTDEERTSAPTQGTLVRYGSHGSHI